jgi:conjugal transfer pilus assembly protein TraE
MSPENSLNERLILKSQVKFLRVMSIGLIAAIFALITIEGFIFMRETTVIVPAEVRRPYELGADFASTDYLTDMANYVLDKVLTVTPESIDYNNRVILKMTHPDGYPNLKSSLDAAALRLKKERITTVWIPRNEKVSTNAKTVEVSGQLKTYIADLLTSTHDKTYLVQFTVTLSGRLYVSSIEEVIKRDPATGKPAVQP